MKPQTPFPSPTEKRIPAPANYKKKQLLKRPLQAARKPGLIMIPPLLSTHPHQPRRKKSPYRREKREIAEETGEKQAKGRGAQNYSAQSHYIADR